MKTRLFAYLLLIISILVGCSRSMPTSFHEHSPASTASPESPPATVTQALDEEPPLPGEPTDQWPGLDPDSAQNPSTHEHHGHSDSQTKNHQNHDQADTQEPNPHDHHNHHNH